MQFTQTMVHSCILCTPQLADEVVGGRGTVETINPQKVLFSIRSEKGKPCGPILHTSLSAAARCRSAQVVGWACTGYMTASSLPKTARWPIRAWPHSHDQPALIYSNNSSNNNNNNNNKLVTPTVPPPPPPAAVGQHRTNNLRPFPPPHSRSLLLHGRSASLPARSLSMSIGQGRAAPRQESFTQAPTAGVMVSRTGPAHTALFYEASSRNFAQRLPQLDDSDPVR